MWFPWCSRSRHALIKTVFAVGWKQRMGGGLSVEVWCFADPPSLESLSGSHCHFTNTFVWLLLVVLKVWLVSLFAKNYICFKSKTGWLLKKHICMSSAWSHSMSLTAFTEKWNFFQHIWNPKGKIFFFFSQKCSLQCKISVKIVSSRWLAFTESAFPLTSKFPKLKRHEVKAPWHQLASLATAVETLFFCLFHLRVTDAYQAIVHVGARLKCGIIYIFVWEGVFGEGVGGGCLFLLDSKQKRSTAWFVEGVLNVCCLQCALCKSTPS